MIYQMRRHLAVRPAPSLWLSPLSCSLFFPPSLKIIPPNFPSDYRSVAAPSARAFADDLSLLLLLGGGLLKTLKENLHFEMH